MKRAFDIISIFVALAIIIQSSSCGKTDEPQTHCDSSNTAYIPTDARTRFFFKAGTYWIYKNNANNELDTIVVENWYHTIEPPLPAQYGNAYKNKCYERAAYRTISNKYGWMNVRIDFSRAFTQVDSTVENYYITESSQNILYFTTYRWEYKGGLMIDSLTPGLKVRLNSLEINNKTYTDIIYYKFKPGFEASDYLNEAWYANKIGLIKLVRKDGTTWELIHSNIIQ